MVSIEDGGGQNRVEGGVVCTCVPNGVSRQIYATIYYKCIYYNIC